MFLHPFFKRQFSIRKLSVGICSVAIGLAVVSGQQAYAQETSTPDNGLAVEEQPSEQPVEETTEAVADLNLVKNPSFDNDDYVAKEYQDAKYRDTINHYYYADGEGKWGARTKANTANDYVLFGIDTEPGKSYTASANIYVQADNGYSPTGAFFDVKTFSPDGSQNTIPGGKSVSEMTDSFGQWAKQSIEFTAKGDKTYVGLIKWNDDQQDAATLNTNVFLDNLKVSENTKYHEVWKDEFKGDLINQEDWGYELGNIRGNEQQHYSSSKENVRLEDGHLVLQATERPVEDQYRNTERHGDNARLVKYNSGSVRTHGKKEFLYGRIEAKMQLPKGKGVFPAFWTLGADFPIDGRISGEQGYNWPATGEIDIMEIIGAPTAERAAQGESAKSDNSNRIAYGTPHFFYPDSADGDKDGAYAPTHLGGNVRITDDFANNFHIFGINWTKDKIEWYVDDVVYHTLDFNKVEEARRESVRQAFNRPQYIQFNLATGGGWAGDAGDHLAEDNALLKVDWVRWLQSDQQKEQMEAYYATQPSLEGVRDRTIVKGQVVDLLEGVATNSSTHRVDYSIDNEYSFVNGGVAGGRNEVSNVVVNAAEKEKLAQLEPGVYNLYYSTVPTQDDYSPRSIPVYRITRRSSHLVVLPEQLEAEKGAKLESIALPEGFAWVNPQQEVTEEGAFAVVYTNPFDKLTELSNRRTYQVQLPVSLREPKEVKVPDGYPAVLDAPEATIPDNVVLDFEDRPLGIVPETRIPDSYPAVLDAPEATIPDNVVLDFEDRPLGIVPETRIPDSYPAVLDAPEATIPDNVVLDFEDRPLGIVPETRVPDSYPAVLDAPEATIPDNVVLDFEDRPLGIVPETRVPDNYPVILDTPKATIPDNTVLDVDILPTGVVPRKPLSFTPVSTTVLPSGQLPASASPKVGEFSKQSVEKEEDKEKAGATQETLPQTGAVSSLLLQVAGGGLLLGLAAQERRARRK